ncbi:SDR family oxidoreductase [Neorhizobium sp. IRS_2294]|uniref:SDR family oxidoreductase n=1 Tax=unclassified Neorhizobium TaxID=2629175 RepID=UPI003D2DCD5F
MHVIVTGGSSGIGLEVARIYACRGARVSIIARTAAMLESAVVDLRSTGKADIRCERADVANDSEISRAVDACEAAFGPCDVLVASAGMVEPAFFDQQSQSDFSRQIDVNLLGTANAVRSVYAGMKSRGQGAIMIVSSGAALIGIPGYTAYCASKSALTGFAEALQAESVGDGVTIALCFPPDTETPQFERELAKRPAQARALMGAAPPWKANAVAEKIVRGIDRRSKKVYFGFSITGLGLFGPLVKPFVAAWFSRRR